MKLYLANFSEPVEWFTYRDKFDKEKGVWIENGKEIRHFEKSVEFYSATEAKRFIKEHLDVFVNCSIMQVYSNGDWISCGELNIKGSNSRFIANSERNMQNYNY